MVSQTNTIARITVSDRLTVIHNCTRPIADLLCEARRCFRNSQSYRRPQTAWRLEMFHDWFGPVVRTTTAAADWLHRECGARGFEVEWDDRRTAPAVLASEARGRRALLDALASHRHGQLGYEDVGEKYGLVRTLCRALAGRVVIVVKNGVSLRSMMFRLGRARIRCGRLRRGRCSLSPERIIVCTPSYEHEGQFEGTLVIADETILDREDQQKIRAWTHNAARVLLLRRIPPNGTAPTVSIRTASVAGELIFTTRRLLRIEERDWSVPGLAIARTRRVEWKTAVAHSDVINRGIAARCLLEAARRGHVPGSDQRALVITESKTQKLVLERCLKTTAAASGHQPKAANPIQVKTLTEVQRSRPSLPDILIWTLPDEPPVLSTLFLREGKQTPIQLVRIRFTSDRRNRPKRRRKHPTQIRRPQKGERPTLQPY